MDDLELTTGVGLGTRKFQCVSSSAMIRHSPRSDRMLAVVQECRSTCGGSEPKKETPAEAGVAYASFPYLADRSAGFGTLRP